MADPDEQKAEVPDPGFDGRLARLEELVGALEEGGLELEPSIEGYKEGVALLKSCREILAGYQAQVQELGAEAEATTPYAGDPDAPGRGE